ncbi:MAG TPA: TonB-dependent siderophore receptor [Pyrinomonadaceae bacterium]|nr:TonB-dependent siderophore receptor [Pyrinomonadaceae bacterium]
MRIKRKILLWTMFLLTLCVVNSFGQNNCFKGTVKDANDAVIADATVLIKNEKGKVVEKTTSNSDGEFSLNCFEDGEYLLTISKEGMSPIEKKIILSRELNKGTEIVLQAKEVNEMVTVNIEPAFVSSTSETATKTSIPLRDIPQSVEIVNRQLLDSQAVMSLKDALYNVTAVSVAQGEGRRDQFFIRGFSAVGDQFIDGVRDDAQYYRDLSNIEQIEVVKGPSAVLFGRGSSGGIINRTTKKPNVFERIGSVETNFGSYGFKRGSVDFGNPFIKDKLGFRVIGAFQQTGSFRQFYEQKNYSFAPSLAWKPTAKTDITFQFEYLNDERATDRGVPSFRGRPLNVPISTSYGYSPLDNIRNRVSSQGIRIEQQLTQTWTIRNYFRRIGTATDFYNTPPNGVCLMNANGSCSTNIASNIAEGDSRLRVLRQQYNGRARQANYFNQTEAIGFVNTFGIQHNLLFGMEIGRQNKDSLVFRNSTAAPVSFLNPILTKPVNTGIATTNNNFKANVLGVYVQDQISFTKNWKALIGIRYDNFKQTLDDFLLNSADLTRTDKQFSPRAGLVYQPTEWLSFYGSYSRSFQPSGENLSLAVNNTELEPELTRNYEAGVKATIQPWRLNTTLSVFRLNRNNIKTTDPLNSAKLILVGEQRTDGIELTFAGSPIDKLDFIAGYSLLDAEILKSNTVSSGVLLQGKIAQLTPRNSGNLWLTYQLPKGFRLGFGGYARAKSFTSANNLVTLPGYARLDASFGWRSEQHYEISFNLKNIANKKYYETSNGDNNIMPGSPINGSVSLRYRW